MKAASLRRQRPLKALQLGADAVVVGTAITGVDLQVQRYTASCKNQSPTKKRRLGFLQYSPCSVCGVLRVAMAYALIPVLLANLAGFPCLDWTWASCSS